MGSKFELVAVTSSKHDPAWKHCEMSKSGDRVHLRCLYCGKIFKGGGIHRLKEHLAGQKGNASTCLRVQPDVRHLMQESLNVVMTKKRKKQKLAKEMSGYNGGNEGEVVALANDHCSLSSDVDLLPVPDTLEQGGNVFLSREEGTGNNKVDGRKKKGRIRKGSVPGNTNAGVACDNTSLPLKTMNNIVNMAIGRFFFDVGIPLDAVNSAYFQPMVDAISSQGTGLVGPSYHELRSWILKDSVEELRNDINQFTRLWGNTGCSVLVDELVSGKGKTFITFLVYSPERTIFLRSVDISSIKDSVDAIYELLKKVVEEVGIRNVLQVVTNNDERYAVAGQRLVDTHRTIFWTPCAAGSVDMMLEDIQKLEWINTLLQQAKSISKFMYNHNGVLNMARRYTFGVDLVDPGSSRAATDFLTLKRMVNIRHNLQSMVTSEEWVESPYAKRPEGLMMLDYVSSQSFWASCSLVTRLTDPLLRLLRIVSSEKRPSMRYVYAGLYRAKEAIKKELVRKKDYIEYWSIIDRRWEQFSRHPLHAAGFYLNPKFFYSTEGDAHLHIRSLVYDCIEKLVPDPKVQDKIVKEIASYHSGSGDFGRKMAIRARETLCPDEWWSTYGGCCPNLARFAIRILSQTCGLVRRKPTQAPLEQMHEAKNCLERQRLCDLVFVQYNSWLGQMNQKNREHDIVDPISYQEMSVVEDWVAEKEFSSDEVNSSDWMTVDPPFGNAMLLGEAADDIEALGAGFDDYEIFEGAKDSEEENGEDNAVG